MLNYITYIKLLFHILVNFIILFSICKYTNYSR
nr:MAG TPA: ATP synthase [Caudoviricetes sp.]